MIDTNETLEFDNNNNIDNEINDKMEDSESLEIQNNIKPKQTSNQIKPSKIDRLTNSNKNNSGYRKYSRADSEPSDDH